MNLSVKNVKIHDDMSEETMCFSCDLYDNGKLVAHVSNRGIGGCNDLRPAEGLTWQDVRKYEDIDTECTIMELCDEYDIVTKHQARKLVMKKDGKMYTVQLKQSVSASKKVGGGLPLANLVKKKEKEGYTILNRNI